ncbi:MAG: FAD-dependent oxidoreductase [Pseudomonadota bacterium]
MKTAPSILSVNLEDYFQAAPMRDLIPSRNWSRFSTRVETSAETTLDLLDKYDQRATFFVLGWIAERYPDLIAEIVRRGHAVASKGYLHRQFRQMTLGAFEEDLRRSIDAIATATGQSPLGYRIAEGSLPTDDLRPFEILAEAGIRYDSSIRPFGMSFVGKQKWRDVQTLSGQASTGAGWSLTEVPLSTDRFLGMPVPLTGGNYFRQMPKDLYERRLDAFLKRTDQPWHFYFHSWELDPEQPRVSAASLAGRIRQYRNLEDMPKQIEELINKHAFASIEDYLGLAPAPANERASPTPFDTVYPVPTLTTRGPMTKVTLVVPCYNEQATLPYLEKTLASFADENAATFDLSYVMVDDGSTDETWATLLDLFGDRDDCTLVQHGTNSGIAAATMTGIKAAKNEVVCSIDCDCTFDPHELANMIPLLTPDVDMVQASPYHPKGGVVNVPAWRLFLSKNLSRLYGRILNHKFSSYTACFRVYRRSKVVDIDLRDGGFLGIMEMFVLLDQAGAKIVEYPAVLETRLLGVSKMRTLKVIGDHVGMLRDLVMHGTAMQDRALSYQTSPSAALPALTQHGQKERWCIIGGGMLGLSLAHKFATPSRSLTVIEASDRLGGLADAWQLGPITWDRHYHVALMSDRYLMNLLRDIGLDQEMRWTTTKSDFYTGDAFHPLNNAIDYLRFPAIGLIDKARLAFTILYASRLKNGVRLESIPVADWLIKLSGRTTYEKIWKHLLRAKLGDNHKIASASFIWSVINRFYAARRSGLKQEMFGTVKGGYDRIITRLCEHLHKRGVETRTDTPVRSIRKGQDGIEVTLEKGTETFDRVIITAASPLAARLCAELTMQERVRLESMRYQGVVCASLVLRRPLRGRYITYIADESVPFTGIIEMTAVVPREDFDGRTLVYLPTYVPAEDPLFDMSDEAIRGRCVASLTAMYEDFCDDDIEAFRVSRARNVLAVQTMNYSQNVPPMETSLPGVSIVNASQIINGNLNVNETIELAEKGARFLERQPSRAHKVVAENQGSLRKPTEAGESSTEGELV